MQQHRPPGAYTEQMSTPVTTIDPGTNGLASVTCPQGSVAIGGGGSGQGVVYLTGSYPVALDKWVVSATNPPGGIQRELKARALCGPEPRNFLPPSAASVSIDAGQAKSASVTCSSGVRVSGGGYTSGSGIYLTDSYPKANGWTVYAVNTGSGTASLTAVVRCARA